MLTFCSLVLLSPDRLCVEVIIISPVVAGTGHIVLIIVFINHDEHILQPFNPFSAGPEISRVKKMSRCRRSRDISGQSVFFTIVVCKINVVRQT